MAKDKLRVSKTGVTSGGRIALYSNSKEVSDLDPSLVRFIPGNSLSSLYLTSDNFDDSLYGEEGTTLETGEGGETDSSNVPSPADISIVSQEIVYDKTGQPSVSVIFKVKNLSGLELKGINARIELV